MPCNLKIFSFFSGCGFLDLGFELSGFDIEFVNEYSKSFIEAYQYSRSKMKIRTPKYGYCNTDINEYLDARKDELREYIIAEKSLNNLVGFIGGPPCPGFSVAGKNRGRNGDNGKLSLSYVNLIESMEPDFFLFENVKGLWRTARHREFYEELKQELINVGYSLTDRLTNALEYGAPQDRDRILLFGIKSHLIEGDRTIAFPWDKYHKYSMDQIRAYPWPQSEEFVCESDRPCPNGIPKELTVQYWFNKNDVINHPNANEYFRPKQGLAKMRIIQEGDDSRKSYKRLHRWRYSPTAAYGNNEVHLHPYKERRISVAEALAIQSLPKEFILPKEMSLTDKFKTIGNGVPFVMSCGIAKTVYDYLEENVCKK